MIQVGDLILNITEELQETLRQNPPTIVDKPVISKKKDSRNTFVQLQETDENGDGKTVKATISTHPFVYFDKNGNFYFNVFRTKNIECFDGVTRELIVTNPNVKTSPDCNLYGRGIISHYEEIPGSQYWMDGSESTNPKKEAKHKGDPETLIVKKMSREEVLKIDIKPKGESLVSKVSNATDAEKQVIAEQIFGKDFMEAFKLMKKKEELDGE